MRELIGKLVPGYEGMSGINESKTEFHVTGRAVSDYKFPTESGRARFHAPAMPENTVAEHELRLMTVRSEGQFNSVVYDDEDLYRGQERRDVILMNAEDMRAMGLKVDQPVKVTSECGELRMILPRPFDVRRGNALMYYPEANFLVPHKVDPLSKTPGFKGVPISVSLEQVARP